MRIIDAKGIDSHLPVLGWAQRHSTGSVLEFGGGLHSTAWLAQWDAMGYRTLTVEESPEWREWLGEKFPRHVVVPEATDAILALGWGAVLIDHGEGEWAWIEARAAALEAVKGHCQIALVHDWHIGPGHRDDVVESYAYHGWFAPDDGTMHTAMCSDEIDVGLAKIPGGYVYTSWDDAPEEWPN